MQKRIKLFFALYILIVVKVIIFKYPFDHLLEIARTWSADVIVDGFKTANFVPFHTIRMYIEYAYKLNSFENLAGNILAFLPFGIIFPMLGESRKNVFNMLLNVFVLVLGIETFQLCSAFGAFDVDDILLNCLGAWIGYFIYRIGEWTANIIVQKKGRMKINVKEEKEYGTFLEEN